MAHYRGQKALYEAMSRASTRSQATQAGSGETQPPVQAAPEAERPPSGKMQWKAKALQWHSGRMELTLPYSVVTVLSVVSLLALVASFRLGQQVQPISLASWQPQQQDVTVTGNRALLPSQPQTGAQAAGSAPAPPTPAVTTDLLRPRLGSTIVIQEYFKQADLIPVRDFFDTMGIKTEIIENKGAFFLFTTQRFDDMMLKKGSGADTLKERIVELGKQYKAPAGSESFAINHFRGAYLKPIDEHYEGKVINVD